MKLHIQKCSPGGWLIQLLGLNPPNPVNPKRAKRKPRPRPRHTAFLELP